MNEHWSLEDLRLYRATGKEPNKQRVKTADPGVVLEEPKAPKRSKMRNIPVVVDGIRFDSKGEAAYFLHLKSQVKVGAISHFHRQVPIEVGGGVKLWLDFIVVKLDGTLDYIDYKGRPKFTPTYTNKKKQAQARYPIKIREVFRDDVPAYYRKVVDEIHQIAQALDSQ